MKKSRPSEEQIIAILREQEAGSKTADVCRRHGISQPTFYNWKAKYGGLEIDLSLMRKAVLARVVPNLLWSYLKRDPRASAGCAYRRQIEMPTGACWSH